MVQRGEDVPDRVLNLGRGRAGPITDAEIDHFIRQELPKIDAKDYFESIFGSKDSRG